MAFNVNLISCPLLALILAGCASKPPALTFENGASRPVLLRFEVAGQYPIKAISLAKGQSFRFPVTDPKAEIKYLEWNSQGRSFRFQSFTSNLDQKMCQTSCSIEWRGDNKIYIKPTKPKTS